MTKYGLKQPVEAMQLSDFLESLEFCGSSVLEAHDFLPAGYSMDYAINGTGVCLYHENEPDWMIPVALEDWLVFLGDGPAGAGDGELDIYENALFVEMFGENGIQ